MANVLVLSLVFPPDSVSTAQIMGDLALDLQAHGHRVSVLTTTPHYNRDAAAEARQPRTNHWGPVLQHSTFHGIPVYHVWMPRKGKNVVARIASWLSFHLLSTLAGFALRERPEVIIAPSPPLTIGVSAWLLGLFHRAPYLYNVQEIYPDMAIRLGVVRNRWLIRLLYRLERFVYRKAAKITVIASRMRERLLDKGVPAEKAAVIPNFVDIADFRPHPRRNEFSSRHGLDEKFVVSYAGNMGPAQGLETLLEAASLLKDQPEIRLVMLGDGVLRKELEQQVQELGLDNVLFLPYQSVSLMPKIYSASDVSLVPLGVQASSDAVPSKVYRIMACARPVLAVAEPDSDLAHLVESVNCGGVTAPGCARSLADAILAAYRQREEWRRRGQAGRDHVVNAYSRECVTRQYHTLIEDLTKERRCAA